MFGVWELESLSSINAGDDVLAQAGDGQLRADDAALQSQRVAGSQHLPHIALALHAAQVPPERFRAAVENLYYVSTRLENYTTGLRTGLCVCGSHVCVTGFLRKFYIVLLIVFGRLTRMTRSISLRRSRTCSAISLTLEQISRSITRGSSRRVKQHASSSPICDGDVLLVSHRRALGQGLSMVLLRERRRKRPCVGTRSARLRCFAQWRRRVETRRMEGGLSSTIQTFTEPKEKDKQHLERGM